MSSRDVLIVGAGPAGATAAILLARAGARVTLLDKARFPREKLCGEFVSPEAIRILDRAGVLRELEGIAGRASHVLLSEASGRSARLPLPRPRSGGSAALGIPRLEMDAALVERAARSGAEIVEGLEVRRAVVSNGRASGVAACERGSAREVRLEARFVLAADGRDSALARALSPAVLRDRASPMFGLKAHFRNVRGIEGAVELHYFRGGYVGLHDVGRGRVNLCALIDRSLTGEIPRDPDGVLRDLFFRNAAARARLEGAERVTDWLAVGSLTFRAEAAVRAGVLFLGDAAGTIDPFAGEGMSMAFRSAEIAAEEVGRALGEAEEVGRSLREFGSAEAAYASRWRNEFSLRIGLCRVLGRLAIRPWAQAPALALFRSFPPLGELVARSTRAGVARGCLETAPTH